MTVPTEPWSRSIRFYFLLLIGVAGLIGATAVGVLLWQESETQRRSRIAHDYHLLTSLYCSRAQDVTQHLVAHVALSAVGVSMDRQRELMGHTPTTSIQDTVDIAVETIQEYAKAIDDIHVRYADPRFEFLNSQLRTEVERLDIEFSTLDHGTNKPDFFTASSATAILTDLQATLEQLRRLHSAAYEDVLGDLEERRGKSALHFSLLVVGLLTVGFVAVRRILELISRVIDQRRLAEDALVDLNATLEQRVEARTRELRREVGERRRAEERLRFTQFSVDHAMDGLFWITPTGRFFYVNDAACDGLGYSRAELLGKSIVDVEPDARGETWTRRWTSLRNSGNLVFETLHRHKDGATFPVEVSGNFLEFEGNEYAFVFVRDITERRKAEADLRAYQDRLEHMVELRTADLTRAYEELQSFAYAVSHDLRSPLASVKGFSNEIRHVVESLGGSIEHLLTGLPEDRREHIEQDLRQDLPEALQFIEAAVERMERLTAAILQLSRLGRRELTLELVNLNEMVEASLDANAYPYKEKDVRTIIGRMPMVITDRLALEQVLDNLLSNAIKYLDANRPGRIEIFAEQVSGATLVRIRDNGRGIAAKDVGKIFEMFRRVGDTTVPGEGMGLAYVRTLVRRLGGRIWCDSVLGQGSTFNFTLPDRPPLAAMTSSVEVIDTAPEESMN